MARALLLLLSAAPTAASASSKSFIVHVKTATDWFAGTNDYVRVLLRGDGGDSGWQTMDIAGNDFEGGQTGNYRVESPQPIVPREVCLRKDKWWWWRHDGWLPEQVQVFDGDMKKLGQTAEAWGWIDHGYETCKRLEDPPQQQRPPADASLVFDALLMADIGHAREYAETLTDQYPYGKCRVEGSFSLYEGLQHFVRSGHSPKAVFLLGDVVYGGGDARNNAEIRSSFQKYLEGKVPADMVFPQIGNHDVNLQGCTLDAAMGQACYYGSATTTWSGGFVSRPQLSFEQWRANWLGAFPGLASKVILPPSSGGYQWQAPLRYNVDPGSASSVYFIAGLVAGVRQPLWGPGQPQGAFPGDDGGGQGSKEECAFIQDSLAHGRSLGKTVFVYVTHDGSLGGTLGARFSCDRAVMRQLDVWLFGHEHFAAQTPAVSSPVPVRQEDEEFPAQLLVGNGGFDQGDVDTVSFVHMREYHVGGRVRLHFDVYDTCVSSEVCNSELGKTNAGAWASHVGIGHCLEACHHFEDGVAGRKATPSKQHLGFVYDAPQRQGARQLRSQALSGQSVRIGAGPSRWLGLRPCADGARCLALVEAEREAAAFRPYHIDVEGAAHWARLATDDEHWGPVVLAQGRGLLVDGGFWQGSRGAPRHGFRFKLLEGPAGWEVEGIEELVEGLLRGGARAP